MDLLDFDTLDALAATHGDAFYILKPEAFEANVQALLGALREGYANAALGYSVKTNYLPALMQQAGRLGCYAEVVSTLEYDLALKAGFEGRRILFNGPVKSRADLERAFAQGARVNIDSWAELEILEALPVGAAGRRVGVRCNFEVEPGFQSRFGFSLENGSLAAALERLRRLPALQVAGLHCHFTTRGRSAAAYGWRVEALAGIARDLLPGTTLDDIDIGGGIFGPLDDNLRSQFSGEVPGFADYAACATRAMRAHFAPERTQLIMEPGVALTANVLDFYARIVDVKQVGTRRLALCAGSVHNVKPSLNQARLTTHTVPRHASAGAAPLQTFEIVGYTCLEHDNIGPHSAAGLAAGDFVRFDNVGAYTLVFTPPFIQPAPAILSLQGGQVQCLRRRQTFDDIFASYRF